MQTHPTKSQSVDWKAIEPDWRAGIKSKLQLSDEYGVSRAAIDKHFKKAGIERDLTKRIQDKAHTLVAQAVAREVAHVVTPETILAEKQVVEVNAEIIAQADLINRQDVLMALNVSRGQLRELAALCTCDLAEELEWLVATVMQAKMDQSTKPEVVMKAVGLFEYIISLAGRVKLSKEIAAAHGVYIPMQRKILKLDDDADKGQTEVDALLAKINAASI